MRTFDLTPLMRSTVGFDRIDRLFQAAMRQDETAVSYPPYNIEKLGDDAYRISMAVAGFAEDELDVTVRENLLVISGKAGNEPENSTFLHRGIGRRAFERRFDLAETVKVTGSSLENGLLHVELAREIPEAMKPRKIAIKSTASQPKVIESEAA